MRIQLKEIYMEEFENIIAILERNGITIKEKAMITYWSEKNKRPRMGIEFNLPKKMIIKE